MPSSQKFRGIVFVIVIFCKFYNIRFSCCVKDIYRRSRWRDDLLGSSDKVVLKCITFQNSDVNKSLRICAIYKLMLCITDIQLSADIYFKCINTSDVNIESKIFEILGSQLSADIIFTVYSLYRGST